jgi:hypothetical protein
MRGINKKGGHRERPFELSMNLHKGITISIVHGLPFDVLKEGPDIIRPFQSIIDHEGVFENIQY